MWIIDIVIITTLATVFDVKCLYETRKKNTLKLRFIGLKLLSKSVSDHFGPLCIKLLKALA